MLIPYLTPKFDMPKKCHQGVTNELKMEIQIHFLVDGLLAGTVSILAQAHPFLPTLKCIIGRD